MVSSRADRNAECLFTGTTDEHVATTLDLEGNKIDSEGAKLAAEDPKNKTLIHLYCVERELERAGCLVGRVNDNVTSPWWRLDSKSFKLQGHYRQTPKKGGKAPTGADRIKPARLRGAAQPSNRVIDVLFSASTAWRAVLASARRLLRSEAGRGLRLHGIPVPAVLALELVLHTGAGRGGDLILGRIAHPWRVQACLACTTAATKGSETNGRIRVDLMGSAAAGRHCCQPSHKRRDAAAAAPRDDRQGRRRGPFTTAAARCRRGRLRRTRL